MGCVIVIHYAILPLPLIDIFYLDPIKSDKRTFWILTIQRIRIS